MRCELMEYDLATVPAFAKARMQWLIPLKSSFR